MSNPDVTAFVDDAAVAFRTAEETNGAANWQNGMNAVASNAPGIGINQGGGAVVGTPEQFTLLDQFGDAREAQISQVIGGLGFVDREDGSTSWQAGEGTPNGRVSSGGVEGTLPDAVIRFGAQDADYPDGSGEITFDGNSTLSVLATGWTIEA